MSLLEPTHSFERPLPSLRETIDQASETLVCLDFDGTLAPIVDDPDRARITQSNRRALEALASTPAVTTAVVSGRALSDVRSRVPVPVTCAGNHGLELYREGSHSVHPIAKKRASTVEETCEALEDALERFPQCRVENKQLTGTVHVRSQRTRTRTRVHRIVHELVERIGGDALETSRGKRVLEISPAVPWGKGDAVALLEESSPGDPFVLYVGDDVTDESAFRTVEPDGIGVHVGTDRPSVASCRVTSPSEVSSLLSWIARARSTAATDESVDTVAIASPAGLE
ncbi:trehalose-phosphatase [Natronobiforma cellulositropha]|uniref:trehalose-phosphatase n=1 Tax=Natronobiforma cellulositropha TaxID=1679076 RepID=UPI0021D5A77F|nr:trehalose-phosphatase [Natronobiforma cellulositropha]